MFFIFMMLIVFCLVVNYINVNVCLLLYKKWEIIKKGDINEFRLIKIFSFKLDGEF